MSKYKDKKPSMIEFTRKYFLIFDSLRRQNSPKKAYLCQILTVFVLHRYYVIYCLCFVSLMIFLMLLFVMI